MHALVFLASLGIGTALLPVWSATDARSSEASRTIATSSMDGPFAECIGCKKKSLAFGIGAGVITVTGDLTVGNGVCSGTLPNCYVTTNCTYPATTVTIVNSSGSTLWYSHSALSPRVEILPGGRISITYPAGSLVCGKQEYYAFWDSATDGTNPVAVWGWECTSCPES